MSSERLIDDFTKMNDKHEGTVSHLYKDKNGHITIGKGHLITDIEHAKKLPFFIQGETLTRAKPIQIEQEFNKITSLRHNPEHAASWYKPYTSLFLRENDIKIIERQDIEVRIEQLGKVFPNFPTYPHEAKLAVLDMSYNLGLKGLQEKFPKFTAAVKNQNWSIARDECLRNVQPERNDAIFKLLDHASRHFPRSSTLQLQSTGSEIKISSPPPLLQSTQSRHLPENREQSAPSLMHNFNQGISPGEYVALADHCYESFNNSPPAGWEVFLQSPHTVIRDEGTYPAILHQFGAEGIPVNKKNAVPTESISLPYGYSATAYRHLKTGKIVIAHAGTANIANLMSDASLAMRIMPTAQKVADEFCTAVKAKLARDYPNAPQIIDHVGHSLGGHHALNFGVRDTKSFVVTVDAPGNLELIPWPMLVNLQQYTNIINFVSSSNIVNNCHHRPGLNFRLKLHPKDQTFFNRIWPLYSHKLEVIRRAFNIHGEPLFEPTFLKLKIEKVNDRLELGGEEVTPDTVVNCQKAFLKLYPNCGRTEADIRKPTPEEMDVIFRHQYSYEEVPLDECPHLGYREYFSKRISKAELEDMFNTVVSGNYLSGFDISPIVNSHPVSSNISDDQAEPNSNVSQSVPSASTSTDQSLTTRSEYQIKQQGLGLELSVGGEKILINPDQNALTIRFRHQVYFLPLLVGNTDTSDPYSSLSTTTLAVEEHRTQLRGLHSSQPGMESKPITININVFDRPMNSGISNDLSITYQAGQPLRWNQPDSSQNFNINVSFFRVVKGGIIFAPSLGMSFAFDLTIKALFTGLGIGIGGALCLYGLKKLYDLWSWHQLPKSEQCKRELATALEEYIAAKNGAYFPSWSLGNMLDDIGDSKQEKISHYRNEAFQFSTRYRQNSKNPEDKYLCDAIDAALRRDDGDVLGKLINGDCKGFLEGHETRFKNLTKDAWKNIEDRKPEKNNDVLKELMLDYKNHPMTHSLASLSYENSDPELAKKEAAKAISMAQELKATSEQIQYFEQQQLDQLIRYANKDTSESQEASLKVCDRIQEFLRKYAQQHEYILQAAQLYRKAGKLQKSQTEVDRLLSNTKDKTLLAYGHRLAAHNAYDLKEENLANNHLQAAKSEIDALITETKDKKLLAERHLFAAQVAKDTNDDELTFHHLDNAQKNGCKDSSMYYDLGILNFKKCDFLAAYTTWQEYLKENPKDYALKSNCALAAIYADPDQGTYFKEAEKLISEVIKDCKDSSTAVASAHAAQAELLRCSKASFEERYKELDDALKAHPKHGQSMLLMAGLYLEQGTRAGQEKALHLYDEYLNDHSDDNRVRIEFALLHYYNNNPQEAMRQLKKVEDSDKKPANGKLLIKSNEVMRANRLTKYINDRWWLEFNSIATHAASFILYDIASRIAASDDVPKVIKDLCELLCDAHQVMGDIVVDMLDKYYAQHFKDQNKDLIENPSEQAITHSYVNYSNFKLIIYCFHKVQIIGQIFQRRDPKNWYGKQLRACTNFLNYRKFLFADLAYRRLGPHAVTAIAQLTSKLGGASALATLSSYLPDWLPRDAESWFGGVGSNVSDGLLVLSLCHQGIQCYISSYIKDNKIYPESKLLFIVRDITGLADNPYLAFGLPMVVRIASTNTLINTAEVMAFAKGAILKVWAFGPAGQVVLIGIAVGGALYLGYKGYQYYQNVGVPEKCQSVLSLYHHNKKEEALSKLQELLKSNGSNPRVLKVQDIMSCKQVLDKPEATDEEVQKVIDVTSQYVTKDKKDDEMLSLRATAYHRLKNREACHQDLRALVDINKSDHSTAMYLAQLLLVDNKYTEAKKYLDKAEERLSYKLEIKSEQSNPKSDDTSDPESLDKLQQAQAQLYKIRDYMTCLQITDNKQLTQEEYDQVVSLTTKHLIQDPSDCSLLSLRASVHQRQKNIKAFKEDLRLLTQFNATDHVSPITLAQLLMADSQYTEATEFLNTAEERVRAKITDIAGKSQPPKQNSAQQTAQKTEINDLQVTLKQINKQQDFVVCLTLSEKPKPTSDDYKKIIELTTKHLNQDPKDISMLSLRASAYQRWEKFEESCEDYKVLTALNPEDHGAPINAAQLLHGLDKCAEAMSYYDIAEQRIKNRVSNIAELQGESQKVTPDEIVKLKNEKENLDKLLIDIRRSKFHANLQLQTKGRSDAETLTRHLYEQYLTLNPTDNKIRMDYALLCFQAGYTEEALTNLKIIRENSAEPAEQQQADKAIELVTQQNLNERLIVTGEVVAFILNDLAQRMKSQRYPIVMRRLGGIYNDLHIICKEFIFSKIEHKLSGRLADLYLEVFKDYIRNIPEAAQQIPMYYDNFRYYTMLGYKLTLALHAVEKYFPDLLQNLDRYFPKLLMSQRVKNTSSRYQNFYTKLGMIDLLYRYIAHFGKMSIATISGEVLADSMVQHIPPIVREHSNAFVGRCNYISDGLYLLNLAHAWFESDFSQRLRENKPLPTYGMYYVAKDALALVNNPYVNFGVSISLGTRLIRNNIIKFGRTGIQFILDLSRSDKNGTAFLAIAGLIGMGSLVTAIYSFCRYYKTVDVPARCQAILAQYGQHHIAEARQQANQLLEQYANNSDVKDTHAYIECQYFLDNQNRTNEECKKIERIANEYVEKDRNNLQMLYFRAMARFYQRNYEASKLDLRQLVGKDPEDPNYAYILIRLLHAQQAFEEAKSVLLNLKNALVNKLSIGLEEAERKSIQETLQQLSDYHQQLLHDQLSQLANDNKNDEILTLTNNTEDVEFLYFRCLAFCKLNLLDDAQKCGEIILTKNENKFNVNVLLAETGFKNKKHDFAIQHFESAVTTLRKQFDFLTTQPDAKRVCEEINSYIRSIEQRIEEVKTFKRNPDMRYVYGQTMLGRSGCNPAHRVLGERQISSSEQSMVICAQI